MTLDHLPEKRHTHLMISSSIAWNLCKKFMSLLLSCRKAFLMTIILIPASISNCLALLKQNTPSLALFSSSFSREMQDLSKLCPSRVLRKNSAVSWGWSKSVQNQPSFYAKYARRIARCYSTPLTPGIYLVIEFSTLSKPLEISCLFWAMCSCSLASSSFQNGLGDLNSGQAVKRSIILKLSSCRYSD